jgi:hypothetical protein
MDGLDELSNNFPRSFEGENKRPHRKGIGRWRWLERLQSSSGRRISSCWKPVPIASVCTRLHAFGLRALVPESCHVGKQAKTYVDNHKMAAARIALVYLAGKCSLCVDARGEESSAA